MRDFFFRHPVIGALIFICLCSGNAVAQNVQPPTLPRRSRAELDAGSEELLEPKDPLTLERHRKFRETLNQLLDSTLSLQ